MIGESEVFVDGDGLSLYGSCSHCQRRVDNHDELHRVTSIIRGGYGVECVLRGDIRHSEAMPLGHRLAAPSTSEGDSRDR